MNWKQRVAESKVICNALWMCSGQVLSTAVQAVYFVVIARLLGSSQYGIFAGAAAFVSLSSQYASVGAGPLFMRYVSMDKSLARVYWGNILLCIGVAGCLLVIVIQVIGRWTVNPSAFSVVGIIAVSDCIFKQLILCAGSVFQTFEEMRTTALLNSLTNALRLLAAITMLIAFHTASAWDWAWASGAVSAIGCVIVIGTVTKRIGFPILSVGILFKRIREGLGFSFAASTSTVYNDIDKTLLCHYEMNVANGIYTTAYRLIDIATMPVWSIYGSLLPRLFRDGKHGIKNVVPTAKKMLVSGMAVGTISSVFLFIMAPVVPFLLGPSFSSAVRAVRWLALLPFFRSFQLSAGGALTGSGFQPQRTISQICAAVFNLGINLYMIPRYSWIGAAWSSLATDALIGASNWAMLCWLMRSSVALTDQVAP